MPNTSPHLIAGGTIRASRFIKLTGAFIASEADANEKVIGISGIGTNNAPIPSVSTAYHATENQQVFCHGEGDEALLEAGSGGWTAGDYLKSDADGKGVSIATTGTTQQEIGAIALQTVAAGEFGRVQVLIDSRYPALA